MPTALVFIDTWAWVALANPGDRHHKLALHLQAKLDAADTPYATTEYVLVETVTFLRRQMGFSAAERFLDEIRGARTADRIVWIPASEVLPQAPQAEFLRYAPSLVLSFTDATSFAAMRSQEIQTAFTSDCDHFLIAGFVTVPSKTELASS